MLIQVILYTWRLYVFFKSLAIHFVYVIVLFIVYEWIEMEKILKNLKINIEWSTNVDVWSDKITFVLHFEIGFTFHRTAKINSNAYCYRPQVSSHEHYVIGLRLILFIINQFVDQSIRANFFLQVQFPECYFSSNIKCRFCLFVAEYHWIVRTRDSFS